MTLPDISDSLALDAETLADDEHPTCSDLDARPSRRGRRLLPLLREGRVRAATLPTAHRTTKAEMAVLRFEGAAVEEFEHLRPRVRGDCLPGGCNEARPCPWVSCSRHFATDVNEESGGVKVTFPDREVWEIAETCSLDIAERGGRVLDKESGDRYFNATLDEIGAVLNVTRERARQVELNALAKLALLAPELRDLLDEDTHAGSVRRPGAQHGTATRGSWDPEEL